MSEDAYQQIAVRVGGRVSAAPAADQTLLPVAPPTILLTGDIADGHLEKAKAVADRVLPKPVDLNLLLRHMSALLNRSE